MFLLRAGEALASSLDYRTTLTTLVREAVPTIADWCAVDLLDEHRTLRRLEVAHRDPKKIEMVRQIEARYPQPRNAPNGPYARLAPGRTDWLADIPDELLVASAQNAEHLALIRALGLRSYISVPLMARGNAVGLFSVVTAESGRRYSHTDVAIVEELARRASVAIDHARTYQAAVDAADRLESQTVELEAQTLELREAEHFARGVMESIADPMVVYDGTWRVKYENAAAVRVFQGGGERASMLGQTLWQAYPDLKGTTFEREMRRAMETRTPATFVEQRGGRWVEVRCYPLPDLGIVAVWKDISNQKRAEQTLRYLARSSDVLTESLDVEATLNTLAAILVPELADWCSVSLVDDGAMRLVAVAHSDAALVQRVRQLDGKYPIDPGGPSRTAQVIRTGKPDVVNGMTEAMLTTSFPDPEYREIALTLGFSSMLSVPLSVGDTVLGAMSLVSTRSGSGRTYTEDDVALAEAVARRAAVAVEKARLYREALASRASAEEANAAKTAFLARMSHELRTPLNAIAGYAELLSLGIRGPVNEAQRLDLERIRSSQGQLLALINDVLNYAKAEAGRLEYVITDVPVADALAGVEPVFARQLSHKQLTYSLAPVDASLKVRADAERLQQILFNLVSNAVKFTPERGRIDVSATGSRGVVHIEVRDTGRGIPLDKIETVFEPFVQVPVKGEVLPGTGLGLAISRDLARAMGGDLVCLPVNVGCVFVLTLPRAGG